MIKDSYRLPEVFTATGKFWLPDDPNKRIPGTLEYTATKISLELHGAFTVKAETASEIAQIRISHIHGTLDDGYSCTLLDVHGFNVGSPFVEPHRSTYSAIYLVVGSHTSGLEELRVQSLTLQCSHLATFVGADPFQGMLPDTNGHTTISYTDKPPQIYRVDSLSASVEFKVRCRTSIKHMEAKLSAEAVVDFTPDESKPIEWFIQTIWRFCDLMRLLTDNAVRPLAIQIRLDKDERYDGWLLHSTLDAYDEKSITYLDMLCSLNCFGNQFGAVLDKWYGMNSTLKNCTYLFRDAHADEGATADGFLKATKSVEAFSRSLGTALYTDPEKYETIRATVVASIPKDIDSDLRESIRKRLQYANEYSFRKRIVTLLRSLSADGVALVCRKTPAFADGVKDTRNYLTHYSDDPDTKPLELKDRFWACQKLLLLMRILLFKYIGVDEADIVLRLKSHPWLSQRISLWQKHKEKPS